MSKAKTIWDKSMSSRKKIFFNSKHDRRMRRWSERAEWYSDMPLDIYAMCGLTDFVHILFPSKKYRHINYYAHLYTAEKTANIQLMQVMHDMTARLLGYGDYQERSRMEAAGRAKPAPKNLENMSFYQILYSKIWPEVRPEIERYTPPVYGSMELYADKYCLVLEKTLPWKDLGELLIDFFVTEFIEGGEKIDNRRCKETLLTPDWDLVRDSIDREAKYYL